MKDKVTRVWLALGAIAAVWTLVRLAAEMRALRQRCTVCGQDCQKDPLDAEPICSWHWSNGGDA